MRHPAYYVLNGQTPVKATFEEWARFFENTRNRRVAEDTVGGVWISTVFLGFDHSFGRGPPLLFETMIFDRVDDSYQTRCTTYEQAEAMHARAVELAKSGLKAAEVALHMARGQPPLA